MPRRVCVDAVCCAVTRGVCTCVSQDRVDTKELRRVEAGITSPSFKYAQSHNLLPRDVSSDVCLSIFTSDNDRSLDLITSSPLESSAIRQGLGLYIAFTANQYQSSVP